MAYERIRHAGGAIPTTLASGISSGATTIVLTDASAMPALAPFYLTIAPDTATEEKIKVGTITGNTLTGCTRGRDGTSAAAHGAGDTVIHGWTATEADEANILVNATLGTIAAKGDLLAGTAAQTLGVLTVGADNLPLVADSAQARGLRYGVLNAAGLGTDAVTTAKILAANVTTAKIADANVTTAKIADDAVTTAKILDANVTSAKIADGTIVAGDLASDAVITAKILDANVTTAKLAAGAVTPAKLAPVPSCRVYRSAATGISDLTDTALVFNTERYDTDTMHDTGSNTGRITFKTAGIFTVGTSIAWDNPALPTGYRSVYIRLNGTTTIARMDVPAVSNANLATMMTVSTEWWFVVNDYVEVVVRHNQGSTLNVNSTASYSPEFWASYQGPQA